MDDSKKRVLLVDDDESILEAMQLALRDQGYDVIVARDGSEALVRAERDAPDLIVLDVIMPKRSGFTVLERIRKGRFRSPRIVMVTANDEPRYRDFAESHGVDAFVPKPFDIDALIGTIHSLLHGKNG